MSSGRGGGGHPGERAGRGARPRAHSPAARAFLLAFSAPFLPRAHYQWSPASDLRRFAGFTLAPPSPPSALQAAALAREGAGGGAPTGGAGRHREGRGDSRRGQAGRAWRPSLPPPELLCGRGSAGAGSELPAPAG